MLKNMHHIERVEIRTNGFKASPNLLGHIENQLNKVFRHENRIEKIQIHLTKYAVGENLSVYTLIGKLSVPGPDLILEENDENLERLISKSSHKFDRLIRKRSRKRISLRKKISLEDMPVAA